MRILFQHASWSSAASVRERQRQVREWEWRKKGGREEEKKKKKDLIPVFASYR